MSRTRKLTLTALFSLGLLGQAQVAPAAEIRVALATALMPMMTELQTAFQQSSGHTLLLAPGTIGAVLERVRGGEVADLVIISQSQIAALTTEGRIQAGTEEPVVSSGIGVMVRAGAPKPDISTPDALKNALLAAGAIAMGDPAGGGASSVHFVTVLERLGISAQIMPKAILVQVGGSPTAITDVVAQGQAEIGIAIAAVIAVAPGVELVGPLPGDLQNTTVYTAGIPVSAAQAEAAASLIEFLSTPAAEEIFRAKGLDPA